MALFSSSLLPTTTLHNSSAFALKPHSSFRCNLTLLPRRRAFSLLFSSSTDNGAGKTSSLATLVEDTESESSEKEEEEEEKGKVEAPASSASAPSTVLQGKVEGKQESPTSNGATATASAMEKVESWPKFKDPRWIGGTWDLNKFQKKGKTDWDSVIDAEARRRKWLEDNPEASSNDEPVVFDTSIVPWWAWIKRFHLPEAELLNGRAAMIGFFMAYFVDSLTGVGLVDQMGNFFCKTLLFVAVLGVLFVRKNEDIDNLKTLIEETTFYDKQWQATWQDQTSSSDQNKEQI